VFKINRIEFKDGFKDLDLEIDDNEIFSLLKENDNAKEEKNYTNEVLRESINKNKEKLMKLKQLFNINLEIKNYKKSGKDKTESFFDNITSLYEKVRKIRIGKNTNLNHNFVCSVCQSVENVQNNLQNNKNSKEMAKMNDYLNCNCQKVISFLNYYMTT